MCFVAFSLINACRDARQIVSRFVSSSHSSSDALSKTAATDLSMHARGVFESTNRGSEGGPRVDP